MVINCNDLRRWSPISLSNGCIKSPGISETSASSVCSSSTAKCNTVQVSINSACDDDKTCQSTLNNNSNYINDTSKKPSQYKSNNKSIFNNASSLSSSSTSSCCSSSSGGQVSPETSSLRDSLYLTMEKRGIDSVCLVGACDADVIDFASKVAPARMKRIRYASLKSASIGDKGLEIFLAALNQSLVSLELIGKCILHPPPVLSLCKLQLFSSCSSPLISART